MELIPSGFFIGKHIPKENASFYETVQTAHSVESITSFQIFLSGSRSYYLNPKFIEEDIKNASKLLQLSGLKMVIHAAYIYNLCGATDLGTQKAIEGLKKTKLGLVNELDMAVALGNENYTPPVVIHTGSCKDKKNRITEVVKSISSICEMDGTITERVAKMKNITPAEVKNRRVICLENAAGEGNKIGSTIEELAKIYNHELLSNTHRKRLCFCIDTAHLYGEGTFDFGNKSSIKSFIATWRDVIPLNKIKVLHYNDSIVTFGSRKDRHELLGCGYMLDYESPESQEAVSEVVRLLKNDLNGCIVIFEPPRYFLGASQWLWKVVNDMK